MDPRLLLLSICDSRLNSRRRNRSTDLLQRVHSPYNSHSHSERRRQWTKTTEGIKNDSSTFDYRPIGNARTYMRCTLFITRLGETIIKSTTNGIQYLSSIQLVNRMIFSLQSPPGHSVTERSIVGPSLRSSHSRGHYISIVNVSAHSFPNSSLVHLRQLLINLTERTSRSSVQNLLCVEGCLVGISLKLLIEASAEGVLSSVHLRSKIS